VPNTEIFADTRGPGKCRSCEAAIEWAEIVRTGKRMPFNAPIVALRTRHEGGRLVEEVDLATSHFATCPESKHWSKRGRR
jgi:hypothetical protein